MPPTTIQWKNSITLHRLPSTIKSQFKIWIFRLGVQLKFQIFWNSTKIWKKSPTWFDVSQYLNFKTLNTNQRWTITFFAYLLPKLPKFVKLWCPRSYFSVEKTTAKENQLFRTVQITLIWNYTFSKNMPYFCRLCWKSLVWDMKIIKSNIERTL